MKIITIIGKTNTGKSTLFNLIVKKKESTVTKKKNTTIRCIEKKINNCIMTDTPGLILNYTDINNKNTNKLIYDSIKKSNLILINIEKKIESEDFFLIDLVKKKKKF